MSVQNRFLRGRRIRLSHRIPFPYTILDVVPSGSAGLDQPSQKTLKGWGGGGGTLRGKLYDFPQLSLARSQYDTRIWGRAVEDLLSWLRSSQAPWHLNPDSLSEPGGGRDRNVQVPSGQSGGREDIREAAPVH